jgi:hypothetical protein
MSTVVKADKLVADRPFPTLAIFAAAQMDRAD